MRGSSVVSFLFFVVALPACTGGGTTSLSPGRAVSMLPARPSAPSGMHTLFIPANSCCTLAVDQLLNRIYVSRTGDPAGSNTTIVDGPTLTVIKLVPKFGGAHNVDAKTRDVWFAGLYAGNAEVYSGRTDSVIAKVSLGACPTDSWVDTTRRHVWISAQCGSGSDPVWAVNADTHAVVAGPIRTGGVMGWTVVNRATGKFYVNNTSGNYAIDPVHFAKKRTAFGVAYAVDARTNLVYAVAQSDALNIVDGRNDKVVQNVPLSHAAAVVAVNQERNHVYLAGGENFIEVRDATTGALVKTISMPASDAVVSLAADAKRARIYAGVASGGNDYLYELHDDY